MKTIIIKICFLALIFSSCGYWINPRYVKMSKKTREEFSLQEFKNISEYYSDKRKIYSINTTNLRELILKSKYRSVLIVFSSYWCSPCHESMPKLKTFLDQNKDKVEIVFISSVDWLDVNKDRLFIDKYGFNDYPLLSINIHEYGSEFMNWNRLSKFIKELIPNYSGEIALPTYLLFDNKGELLSFYNSSFKTDSFKLE